MIGFFDVKQEKTGRAVLSCASCGLYKNANFPKMGVQGKGDKKILLLKSSITEAEDKDGKYWKGESGIILRSELRKLGIDINNDCWTLSAVKCHYTENVKNGVSCCRKNVIQEIEKLQPKIIIALGKQATQSLIAHRYEKDFGDFIKWEGWQIPDQELRTWICPVQELRTLIIKKDFPEVRLLWKQHLKQALSKLDEKIPDYSKDNDLVEIIEDEKEIIKKLKWLYKSQNKFAFDIETTGIKPHDTSKHQIHVISFAYSSTGVFSIPLFPYKEKVIKYLKILLESKSGKIAQNMKFENKWMRIILGIHVNNWVWDTMLATHILDNKTGVTGLKFQTYVQCGIIGYEKDIQPYLITKDSKSANAVNKMEEAMNTPKIRKQMLLYCGLDSLYTFRIAEKQMEVLTWK